MSYLPVHLRLARLGVWFVPVFNREFRATARETFSESGRPQDPTDPDWNDYHAAVGASGFMAGIGLLGLFCGAGAVAQWWADQSALANALYSIGLFAGFFTIAGMVLLETRGRRWRDQPPTQTESRGLVAGQAIFAGLLVALVMSAS